MDKEQLKATIKEKFGSLTTFATVAGIDRYELQKTLARHMTAKEITSMHGMCRRLKNVPTGDYLDPRKLANLKTKIEGIGGVDKFCREIAPEFSRDSVFQILSGKRKRISPVVRKLFDHFAIE